MYLRLLRFLTDIAIHIQYSTGMRRNLDGSMTKYRQMQPALPLDGQKTEKVQPDVGAQIKKITAASTKARLHASI